MNEDEKKFDRELTIFINKEYKNKQQRDQVNDYINSLYKQNDYAQVQKFMQSSQNDRNHTLLQFQQEQEILQVKGKKIKEQEDSESHDEQFAIKAQIQKKDADNDQDDLSQLSSQSINEDKFDDMEVQEIYSFQDIQQLLISRNQLAKFAQCPYYNDIIPYLFLLVEIQTDISVNDELMVTNKQQPKSQKRRTHDASKDETSSYSEQIDESIQNEEDDLQEQKPVKQQQVIKNTTKTSLSLLQISYQFYDYEFKELSNLKDVPKNQIYFKVISPSELQRNKTYINYTQISNNPEFLFTETIYDEQFNNVDAKQPKKRSQQQAHFFDQFNTSFNFKEQFIYQQENNKANQQVLKQKQLRLQLHQIKEIKDVIMMNEENDSLFVINQFYNHPSCVDISQNFDTAIKRLCLRVRGLQQRASTELNQLVQDQINKEQQQMNKLQQKLESQQQQNELEQIDESIQSQITEIQLKIDQHKQYINLLINTEIRDVILFLNKKLSNLTGDNIIMLQQFQNIYILQNDSDIQSLITNIFELMNKFDQSVTDAEENYNNYLRSQQKLTLQNRFLQISECGTIVNNSVDIIKQFLFQQKNSKNTQLIIDSQLEQLKINFLENSNNEQIFITDFEKQIIFTNEDKQQQMFLSGSVYNCILLNKFETCEMCKLEEFQGNKQINLQLVEKRQQQNGRRLYLFRKVE